MFNLPCLFLEQRRRGDHHGHDSCLASSKSHRRCGVIWSLALKTIADPSKRDRWARLRLSIISPLLAAPPGPGQLNRAFNALTAKTWRHPVTGLDVRFGTSTLER